MSPTSPDHQRPNHQRPNQQRLNQQRVNQQRSTIQLPGDQLLSAPAGTVPTGSEPTGAVPGAVLRASGVSLQYEAGTPIVTELDLTLPPGRITMIVGANGCGKSTLLRGLSRLLRPTGGSVVLDGNDIHRMSARELAKRLGLLPQSPIPPEGITVEELVGRGRSPHQGWFGRLTDTDRVAVREALRQTGCEQLADRPVDELSGGQRQRAWIAMVLAQQTEVLLLDEPTTFLDIAHQVDVLDTVCELNANRGTTVAIVLHDLNLAARYADHLVALKDGLIVAAGPPVDVVTEQTVQQVFGLRCTVITDPVAGTPLVIPLGRHQRSSRKST